MNPGEWLYAFLLGCVVGGIAANVIGVFLIRAAQERRARRMRR